MASFLDDKGLVKLISIIKSDFSKKAEITTFSSEAKDFAVDGSLLIEPDTPIEIEFI